MSQPDGESVVSATEIFEKRRAQGDKNRKFQELQAADAAAQQTKKNKLADLIAAEDNTREYSRLVKEVKSFHHSMRMTEGFSLDVHATANPDRPLYILQVDEKHKGAGCVGYFMGSIDLTEPFSEQWPEKYDKINAKMAAEISKGNGMLADGSMFTQHSRAVAAQTSSPVHDPDAMRAAVAEMHNGGTAKVINQRNPAVG